MDDLESVWMDMEQQLESLARSIDRPTLARVSPVLAGATLVN